MELRKHQAAYDFDKVREWQRYWQSEASQDERMLLRLAANGMRSADPLRVEIERALASDYVSKTQFYALKKQIKEQLQAAAVEG